MQRDREVQCDRFKAFNAVEVVKKNEQRDRDDEYERDVRNSKPLFGARIEKRKRDAKKEEVERCGHTHATGK